ncbi:hypothetical protein E2562_012303 [Oryza meyeriana var. granulata]|uniref:Uncharacterized protein n=1 Tax=Oryza meyeriana var. granulata TaxID=110450 RepID=A0A6G1DHX6_9ORYZ|nr:hypothetical protein E2562_012303 [Oryza meyeriana var. granulata]
MAQHTSRLALLALVCTVVVVLHHATAVHGLRRAELILGPAPAPAPAPLASSDTAKERFAAKTAATSDAAAQTSKWRVRRGSDPIHNRS